MINIEKRPSLLTNRSSISMILGNTDKKESALTTSTPKLPRSTDTQPRLSIIPSTRTIFKLPTQQYNDEKLPFSQSKLTHRTSILTNDK